jgi:hypothetical protein
MRRIVPFCALLAIFSGLALAESWQGRLLDATCFDQQKNATTCDATSATTMFSLYVADKAYKLDDAGNGKAVQAMKSRADRSSDPAKPLTTVVMAKITGSKEDQDILKVETVELQ